MSFADNNLTNYPNNVRSKSHWDTILSEIFLNHRHD